MGRRLTEQEKFLRLCARGSMKKIKEALTLGADINKPALIKGINVSPLSAAAMFNNERNMKFLIANGADYVPNLYSAVFYDKRNYAELLIKCGADINAKDARGYNALLCAVNENKTESLKWLIELGADVNDIFVFDDGAITTPLNIAVSLNRSDIAEILLAHGADPDFRDAKGRTAITYSVLTGNEILRLILSHGADPNISDNEGRTPLMLASIDGEIESGIIESLLEYKADPNIRDIKGMTALMWAITGRDRSSEFFLSSLIRTGGLRSEKFYQWLYLASFYTFARREVQLDTVKILIKGGSDLNLRDKRGMNALAFASMNSDDDIFAIISEATAFNNKNSE